MDIDERIAAAAEKFDRLQTERDQNLRVAEEQLTEMTKLQGEWRVLQDMKHAQTIENLEATGKDLGTIEVKQEADEVPKEEVGN